LDAYQDIKFDQNCSLEYGKFVRTIGNNKNQEFAAGFSFPDGIDVGITLTVSQ